MERFAKPAVYRYFLVWLTWFWTNASSYPTRAGSCPGNKPAVEDLHLSYGDGSRHVRSGDLRDSHLQLFLDGTDLTKAGGQDVTLDVGEYYVVEIVANSRPFKGALLRVESAFPMTLVPLINAGIESECESSAQVQGVSHVDNTPKNVLSAGLTPLSEGGIAFDVTVVEYNNATGSVFWYSHFKLRAAYLSPELDNISNDNQCFVCGNENVEISDTDQVVMLSGLALTCNEMSELGRRAQIPPDKCPEAKALATTSCGCRSDSTANTPSPTFPEKCYVCGSKEEAVAAPTGQVFFDNKVTSCLDIYEDGLKGRIPPFDCARAQSAVRLACQCEVNADTLEPTVTPLPTYAEPCFVCGEATRYTTSEVLVQVDDIVVSCFDLFQDGLTGYIPPDLCPKAQQVALEHCGCSLSSTLSPTSTTTPTSTPYPTFSSKCFVCGYGNEVTHDDVVVEINGVRGTCLSLQNEGLAGYIPSQVCDKARVVAEVSCGCSPVDERSENTPCRLCESTPWTLLNMDTEIVVSGDRGTCEELDAVVRSNLLPNKFCSEAQSVARSFCGCVDAAETFEPTVTPAPTTTASPSYSDPCLICDIGQQATATSALVSVDGVKVTCAELEEAGKERLIPPMFCSDAQEQARSHCGCSPSSSSLLTLVPTVTPFPTVTYTPTFADVCSLCRVGEFMTKRDTIVALNGLVLSCQELEEAAAERMISPSLCPLAQQRAQSTCGCKKPTSLPDFPSVSPVRTFHPTITMEPTVTATPTYQFSCNVCGTSNRRVFAPDNIVRVSDILLTCRDLEEAGREASIPPSLCPQAQNVAKSECMCGALAMTFSPTVSPAPTMTPAPSHHRHCQVCSPGWSVSKGSGLVIMAGYTLTCQELESFGATGHLPPDLCFEAKQQAAENCMCLPETLDEGEISVGRISFGSSALVHSMKMTGLLVAALSTFVFLDW